MIPKLAFFDLDGTIIKKDRTVSRRDLEAIARLKAHGTKIAFATGRAVFSAKHLFDLVGVDGLSAFNSAALIYDPVAMKPFRQWNLEKESLQRFVAEAKALNLYAELYTGENYYIEQVTPYTAVHNHYLPMAPTVKCFSDLIAEEPIIKLCFAARTGAEEEKLRYFIARHPQFHYGIATGAAHSDMIFCNATNPEATRENVFEIIRNELGIDASEIMSFGDGESDRTFIQKAGIGVAMGNAPQSVKEAADFVTLHVEDDGVAHAIEKLVFA